MIDQNSPEFLRPIVPKIPSIGQEVLSTQFSLEIDAVPYANSRCDSELIWDEEVCEILMQDIIDGMFGG